jgi:hypothetical protein
MSPRKAGPDPSQQVPRKLEARPGKDGSAADARRLASLDVGDKTQASDAAKLAAELVDETAEEADAALLARPWAALAGHIGSFPKGAVIPPGTFADAAWLRYLIRRGRVGRVHLEGEP